MGKYKQFIIDAHKGEYGSMCSDWREKLEKELPELFDNGKKSGCWYIDQFSPGDLNIFFFCTRIENEKMFGYGISMDKWKNENEVVLWSTIYGESRRATEEEIHKHLTEEAKKRGFVNGASFYGVQGSHKNMRTVIGENNGIEMNQYGLYCGDSYLYFEGKWAELEKKKMTQSDIEKELGYAIEITD